jgi:hypothetical protein
VMVFCCSFLFISGSKEGHHFFISQFNIFI